ncbi:hypothetical protein ACLOJK_016776 [Asimina triloba]
MEFIFCVNSNKFSIVFWPVQDKKRQLKLARQVHPDKNPNDPQAAERFQCLGSGLTSIIKQYWEKLISIAELCREAMLDPAAVFALLFGSELFEDYIGHLAVASMVSSEMASDTENPDTLHDRLKARAFQLLQLQEDIHRQFKIDGSGPESDVETHLRLNKDVMMSSLWKLNVVDIEVTLLHVCEMVLQENDVKKEELKTRAVALKILGKVFQRKKQLRNGGTSRRENISNVAEDDSSSDSSSVEDSPRILSYRTPQITQACFEFLPSRL